MHPSLTVDRIVRAVQRNMRDCDSYTGFCTTCGRKAKQNVEPDARDYPCGFKSCGQSTVYGAEELLLMVQP
jgi:hypothetical protein